MKLILIGVSVKRVHWLRGRAQRDRWREECTIVRYEMQWTVRYFLYKQRFWQSATSADGSPLLSGPAAYANRKAAMWHHLAVFGDRSFKNIDVNYQSVL